MAPQVELARYVKAFHHARVLCVGDSMIDHYINGNVDRI
jgi:bifunctional ADP-heptose synthase (sugar kinase/adenylyltransferase)